MFFDRAIRDSAQADVRFGALELITEPLEDRAHDGIFAVLVAARPDTNCDHVNLQTVHPRKLAFGFVRYGTYVLVTFVGGVRFNAEAIHPAADQVFHSQLLFPTSLFIDG